MKHVMINSGLGNQMFQYAFAKGLEAKGQRVVCDVGLLNDRKIHNGEQIQNLFENVDVVSTKVYPMISRILYYCLYVYKSSIVSKLLHGLNWDLVMDEETLSSSSAYSHQIILGYWQSPKFFASSSFSLKFKESLISSRTAEFEREIYEWGGEIRVDTYTPRRLLNLQYYLWWNMHHRIL